MIITKKFTDHIIAMIGDIGTSEERANLLSEWNSYFSALKLVTDKEQLDEFSGIMNGRLLSGGISVRAPRR